MHLCILLLTIPILFACVTSASGETHQVMSGKSYTLSAPQAPQGQSWSYVWSVSDGSPQTATQSSFLWTAPLVANAKTVLIGLIVSGNETGCRNQSKMEVQVIPATLAKILIKKDCRFNAPVKVGDSVTYTYNVTNAGNVDLGEINLTDIHNWGPNCEPSRIEGDGNNPMLKPGQSWRYECRYTIPDPANYTMLHIMAGEGSRLQNIMKRLTELRIRLEINLNRMRKIQHEFDPSAAALESNLFQLAGINYTSYNYTNEVTGESQKKTFDSRGVLNSTYYVDPISQSTLTTRYDYSGKIIQEELYYQPPGTREYIKIEYDHPSIGYNTITVTDYKSGDTLIVTEDSHGNIFNKEYKKTPGYQRYEERYIIKNTATVKAKTPEGQVVSDSDTYSLEIFKQKPVLVLNKEAMPDPAKPGSIINYTITYKNNGGQAAHDVALKETYGNLLEFIQSNPAPDFGSIDTWTLGDLDVGESGKIAVQAKLNASAIPGSSIANRVDMTSKEGSGAEAWANITVAKDGLVISKTASARIIAPEEPLVYNIDYENEGSVKQTNVVVHDYLDKNVNFKSSSSNPVLINRSFGRHHWWYVGDLEPGSSGTIEISVNTKSKDNFKDNASSVYNTYKINSTQTAGNNATLETLVVHSLWIKKEANKTAYFRGENITYTIQYGNSETDKKADNVIINDTLPDVEFIGASPSPNILDEKNPKNLTWTVGTLQPRESGTIILTVHIPKKPNMAYIETSSVKGDGFVHVRKKFSTEEPVPTLTNIIEIRGYYETALSHAKSSSTINILGAAGTRIATMEHGSGHYEEDESSRFRSENKSISLQKDIFAEHERTTFKLPGKRNINFDSLWSDRTSAANHIRGEEVSENYMYLDSLQKNSSFKVDMNQTVYKSDANFDSGMAQIGYKKKALNSAQTHQEIDEDYHGSFKVLQSVDSYGENVKYDKSATGKGFVSADRLMKLQSSFEHGSGYYSAQESIQSSSIKKNIKTLYSPVNLTVGSASFPSRNLWQEGMWTVDPEKGLIISEEISSATSIKKEAEMETSSLTFMGSFNGTMENTIVQGGGPWYERSRLEQRLVGNYSIDTAVSLHDVPKHRYLHVHIEKKAIMVDENTVLFLINVTNDGNRRLTKLNVSDRLTPGLSFIDSSLRPIVNGQYVNWTLSSLDVGRTMTIKLRAGIKSDRRIYVNYVSVSAGFNDTRLEAKNYTRFEAYYDPLPGSLNVPPYLVNATGNFNATPIKAEWGSWKPAPCFNMSNPESMDCFQMIDEYYSELERNLASCCASNYEVP